MGPMVHALLVLMFVGGAVKNVFSGNIWVEEARVSRVNGWQFLFATFMGSLQTHASSLRPRSLPGSARNERARARPHATDPRFFSFSFLPLERCTVEHSAYARLRCTSVRGKVCQPSSEPLPSPSLLRLLAIPAFLHVLQCPVILDCDTLHAGLSLAIPG